MSSVLVISSGQARTFEDVDLNLAGFDRVRWLGGAVESEVNGEILDCEFRYRSRGAKTDLTNSRREKWRQKP